VLVEFGLRSGGDSAVWAAELVGVGGGEGGDGPDDFAEPLLEVGEVAAHVVEGFEGVVGVQVFLFSC
jgi:hypothetical protein